MRALASPGIPWTVEVDGPDLVVRGIRVTCFGGGHDAGDDGQTESGVMNDGRNPSLLGVALPIRSVESSTRPSPLAFPGKRIPWLSIVKVWREADGEASAVTCELIDNGPDVAQYPDHAGDLTVAAASHFAGPSFPLERLANAWSGTGFSYRILGAAQYVPAE